MSKDPEIKGTTQFKKKPHRPWKLALLKEAIEEDLNYTENLIPHALSEELADLSKEMAEEAEFPDLTMDLEDPSEEFIYAQKKQHTDTQAKKEIRELFDIEELQKVIAAKMEEKQELTQKMQTKESGSVLIGGFFNPASLNSQNKKEIGSLELPSDSSDLMTTLRLKEEELSQLTKKLELQRAIEEAEQANLSKEISIKAKQLAEERTKQALEQAALSKQQMQITLEQVREANKKLEDERVMRRSLEAQIEELTLRANSAEFTLSEEKMLRKDAEIKAKLSLDQIVATELAKKAMEKEHEDLIAKINQLQTVIENEKSLRKIADHKYQQALAEIEAIEKARQEESNQRRLQRKMLMDMLQEEA